MQKNLSENTGGPNKAVKFVLLAFVAVSIAAAAYRIAGTPLDSGSKAPAAVVQTTAAQPETTQPIAPQAVKPPVPSVRSLEVGKTAVVYYFGATVCCSSCKTIDAYTREAVLTNFTSNYKGWKVTFKHVNIDKEPDMHFVQDYSLNSASVVVQKFSGGKTLKWIKLEKVWELLGDKYVFMNYITDETHRLLDEK